MGAASRTAKGAGAATVEEVEEVPAGDGIAGASANFSSRILRNSSGDAGGFVDVSASSASLLSLLFPVNPKMLDILPKGGETVVKYFLRKSAASQIVRPPGHLLKRAQLLHFIHFSRIIAFIVYLKVCVHSNYIV